MSITRRRLLVGTGAAALTGALALPVNAAKVTNLWERRFHCLVIRYQWNNGVEEMAGFGSGAIIGPRSVVTAAHVVAGGSRVEVIPMYSAEQTWHYNRPFGTFYARGSDIRVREGFISDRLTPNLDYAVVTTTQELAIYGYLNCNGYTSGETCRATGYPLADENDGKGAHWWKYIPLEREGGVATSREPSRWNFLRLGFDSADGLSGAGIVNRNNEVVGIVQGTLYKPFSNDLWSYGIPMNWMQNWIGPIVAGTPRTSAREVRENKLLRHGSDGRVYLIVGGAKLHVPSADEFVAMGYRWEWVEDGPGGSLDAAPNTPGDGTVVRERSFPEVYVMLGGRRCWIRNENALSRFGGWGAVRLAPNFSTRHIPTGPEQR